MRKPGTAAAVSHVTMSAIGVMLIACLTACSHNRSAPQDTAAQDTTTQSSSAQDKDDAQTLGGALLTPAEDLNLKRTPIPEILQSIEQVYSPGQEMSCPEIAAEIDQLSVVLGVDDDVPPNEVSSASQKAAAVTLGAISGIAGGIIPFRGLVKKISGAEAHEIKLRDAYLRGLKRRAYLKGMGQSLGCAPPAAPRKLMEPPPAAP